MCEKHKLLFSKSSVTSEILPPAVAEVGYSGMLVSSELKEHKSCAEFSRCAQLLSYVWPSWVHTATCAPCCYLTFYGLLIDESNDATNMGWLVISLEKLIMNIILLKKWLLWCHWKIQLDLFEFFYCFIQYIKAILFNLCQGITTDDALVVVG